METVNLNIRKLNRTVSLMDSQVKGCLAKRIVIQIKNLLLILPRLFTATNASSSKVRKIVKYYLFYAKPADRTAERTRIIEKLYDNLVQLKRGDGKNWAHGIERSAIKEIAEGRLDPQKCFVKLKDLKAVTPRVLFNLSANQFGQGSPLSTSPHLPMLQYVHSYLDALKKQTGREAVSAAVLSQISRAIGLLQAGNFVKTGVEQANKALAKGERLLIPGGWKLEQGTQPYYYEVIPQGKNRVSFRVYNMSSENGTAIEDVKTKVAPFVEWRGISASKINDPQFWRIVEEMLKGKSAYKSEHVTVGLKKYLDPKEADALATKDSVFMTPQQCGVHKNLNGFLKVHMAGPDYRRLMTSIRLQALVDKVHKAGISKPAWWHPCIDWLPQILAKIIRKWLDIVITPQGEEQLVEKCHSKLAQKITRAYEDKVIGKDFLLRARGLMEKVSVVVERNRLQRMQVKPIRESWSFSAIGKKMAAPLLALGKSLSQSFTSKTGSTVTPKAVDSYAAAFRNLPTSDTAQAHALKTARELCEKGWKEGEDISLNAGLMHYIRQLSLDEKYWKDACQRNADKAKAMIGDLGVVQNTLFKTFLKLPEGHRMRSERAYALTKVQYIQAQLLSTIDVELAKNFPSQSYESSRFFAFYDAKMQKEWLEMQKRSVAGRFCEGGGSSWSSSSATDNTIGASFSRPYRFGQQNPSNYDHRTFWDHVQRFMSMDGVFSAKDASSGSFVKKVKGLISKNGSPSQNAASAEAFVKNAHLFASENLPDWVKGLRDSYLCKEYFINGRMPMGAFEGCERSQGLDFEMKVGESKDSAWVNVRLKGISDVIGTHPSNKESRDYRSMHRAVKPPSIIHQLFEKLKEYNGTEKNLISQGHPEELTELLHLFLNEDSKGMVKLMGFFNKHPQLLEELDYQVLFDLCFKSQHLALNQQAYPDLPLVLGQFLNRHFTALVEQNKIQPAVTLLQQMRRFATYFPQEPSLQLACDKLKGLLRRQGLEPEQKSCIYAEILAIYGTKATLTTDETIDLIAGHTQLTENPLPYKWRDPVTDDACAAAIHLHADAVRRTLIAGDGRPNQAALNAVMEKLRGKSLGQWKVTSQAVGHLLFSTSDEKVHFSPLLGQLVTPGTVVQIPSQIRQHPEFHRLFPHLDKAEIYPGGFRFVDGNKRETLVRMDGETLILEQKFKVGQKEEWCQLITSSQLLNHKTTQNLMERIICAVFEFFGKKIPRWKSNFDELMKIFQGEAYIESALGSRHLVNQYSYWRSHSDPKKLYGVEIKSGKQELEVLYGNGRFSSIKRSDGTILGASSKAFMAFEDSEYVQQWYRPSGELTQVELPRFGLTFTPVKGQLSCDQFKGYKLAFGETIPPLGSFHNYLVLKNDKGEKKVLIPRYGFKALDPLSKEFPDSLKPTYALDRRLRAEDTGKMQYYAFDLMGDKLLTASRTGNIYLANALTHAGELRQAFDFLKKYGYKLSAYSEEEKESLRQLVSSQKVNQSGEVAAIALRSYAGYLYLKNCLDYHVEIQDDEKKAIKELYEAYLMNHRSSPIKPFTADEELFIVYYILEKQKGATPNPVLIRRLVELRNDPDGVEVYQKYKEKQFQQLLKNKDQTADQPTDPKKEVFTLWNEDNELPTSFYNLKTVAELRKTTSLTDPGMAITSSFPTLAKIALQGSITEKHWLKTILCFVLPAGDQGKQDEKDDYKKWRMGAERKRALALSYMLECPDQFKEHPACKYGEKVEYDIVSKWNEATRNTLNKLIDSRPIKSVATLKQPLIQLPAPKLQLERPVPTVAPNAISLSFKTPISWANTCEAAGLLKTQQVPSPNVCPSFTDWLKLQKGTGLDVQEYDGLRKAQQKYATQNAMTNQFTLGTGGVKAIEAALAANREKNVQEIERLKNSIEFLANQPPALASEKAVREFQQWSGRYPKLSIDEVIIAFGQKNAQALLRRNPALDVQTINQLFNQVGSYLILASYEQQRQRALGTLASYKAAVQKGDTLEQQALLQQLGLDLSTKRSYDPAKNPEYLVFEHYVQILIRKEQFDILKRYFETGDLNIVYELIMGWGKSSVIVPLLGLLRAKPDVLSVLIVPPQLLEEVASRTQGIHRDAYGKQLHSLHFDRDSTFTVESLGMMLYDLKTIVKNQECLITTNRSIQCLLLKSLELVKQCNDSKSLNEDDAAKLKILREILTMLRTTSLPLIDEIDSVLDVMLRLVYSFGKKQPPRTEDIELTAHLITLLLTKPELKKLGKVECDLNPDPSAPVMTVELFDTKVRTPFAQVIMESLKTAKFSSTTLTEKVQRFFKGFTAQEKVWAETYLTRRGDAQAFRDAQAFYDAQERDIQNVMALISEQVCGMVKRTMTHPCGVKYGVDHESSSPLAIPFFSAGEPHRGAQFKTSYVTMNKTLQYYIKEGITKKIVKKVVRDLQVKANRQSKEEGIPLDQTRGWKIFKKLCGDLELPSLNLKKQHFAALHDRVNSQFEFKRDFVVQGILPLIEDYEGTLTCNSHNTGSFFQKCVSGLTATLSNADALPGKLKSHLDEEITVKMLNLLWEKSFDRVHIIREGAPEEMFKQMRAFSACNMVIDGGGYFKVKEGNDLPIARAFASVSGKPVAFFGENDALQTLDVAGVPINPASVAIEDRNVLIAQRFGVGANGKVHRTAQGVVTIGRDTTLPKFLQYCGRLYREINRSQTLSFALSEEVENIIRQMVNKPTERLNLGDILVFLVRNRSETRGRDVSVAFQQELLDVKQEILVDALLKVNNIAALQPVINDLLPSWFQKSAKEPADLYGRLPIEETKDVFAEGKRIEATDNLKDLINKHPVLQTHLGWTAAKAKARIDEIVNRMKPLLPPTIISRPGNPLGGDDPDEAAEVETQAELDTEVHRQVEAKRTAIKLGMSWNCSKRYNDLNDPTMLSNGGHFDLSLFMKAKDEFKRYADAFKGIDISTNTFAWPEKAKSATDMELFGPYRTPLLFARVNGDEVCILSDDDRPDDGSIYSLGTDSFYKKDVYKEPDEVKRWRREIDSLNFDLTWKQSDKLRYQSEISNTPYMTYYFQPLLDRCNREIADIEAKQKGLQVKIDDHIAKVGNAKDLFDPAKFQASETFRKVVKIKFLNGDCDYSLAEQKVLRDWFQAQGPQGAAHMQEFYIKHVLKGFPARLQAYRGSALERVFRTR